MMALLTCTQAQLMRGLRAATAAEALLCEEDSLRRYQYTEDWEPNVDLATFNNGGGDDMFIASSKDGVIIKGFDHESDVSPYGREDHSPWPGMFDGVPPQLLRLLDDPAICKEDITFLHWLSAGHVEWARGPVVFPKGERDGSEWLLTLLPLKAEDYIDVAKDYFGADFHKVSPSVIRQHFGG
jgi:hypothetical protein